MFKVQYDLNLTPAEQLKAYGIRKAIRIAANRASAPVKASVVNNAERIKLLGVTAKSIRIKVKVYPGDKYVSIVGTASKFKRKGRKKITRGPLKGQKRTIQPSKYAHLVEWGTKRSKAKPWLKPAKEESAGRYIEDVRREVEKEIAAELARNKVSGT
ncbi:hypothetical protein R5W23_000842 [Gemmata sp. JC673]|uniref:HK97 gp10 family phage protein n=1 Tax=Gemmata algarum TaxID=2975278 RepID=A0ABU5ESQ1_9BACT|nr:HK97-gp10 family putative phage morphogenesis protein [Gemmata algarum]MDY3558121.1 hypothetical protein [Gemmata algarum]